MSMTTVTCHFGHKERVWFAVGFKRPPHKCGECARIATTRFAEALVSPAEPSAALHKAAENHVRLIDDSPPFQPVFEPPPWDPQPPEFALGGGGDFGGGGATGDF